MPTLTIQPCEFDEACSFVLKHHRHHPPPIRCKFQIAVNDGEKIVGVVMVGRPVARGNQDGWTLEVTRCCTDGTKNACSALYAAAWRAARAMGYRRLITYTMQSEPGTSLVAAGWKVIGKTKARSWDMPSRPRVDKHVVAPRLLWEIS